MTMASHFYDEHHARAARLLEVHAHVISRGRAVSVIAAHLRRGGAEGEVDALLEALEERERERFDTGVSIRRRAG